MKITSNHNIYISFFLIVLESDFTGCLSMLMKYPPIDNVQLLVPQAIYLRDHLSPEGGSYVIAENALRAGKILPSYQIPISHEKSRSESIIPDGFVHVTKNVLESRSAVVLNKAILTAVGEVKVLIPLSFIYRKGFEYFHLTFLILNMYLITILYIYIYT